MAAFMPTIRTDMASLKIFGMGLQIGRRNPGPRLSWAQSKSDMIEDLYQYATEVLELDVPAGASLEDIEAALDAKGQNLYWEQVQ